MMMFTNLSIAAMSLANAQSYLGDIAVKEKLPSFYQSLNSALQVWNLLAYFSQNPQNRCRSL